MTEWKRIVEGVKMPMNGRFSVIVEDGWALAIPGWLQPRVDAVLDRADAK